MAQEIPLDLAAYRLWQFVDKCNPSWVFIGRRHLFDVRLQIIGKLIACEGNICQYNERGHNLAALGIGQSDDCTLLNKRVLDQYVFDFLRTNPVPRRCDDVIGSANIKEIAVTILSYVVTGPEPFVPIEWNITCSVKTGSSQ